MKKYDKTMMETAEIWAKQSYCKRRQVGAVIAKEGRIISIGYNGTPSGLENDCEELINCEFCKGNDNPETFCPKCDNTGYVSVTKPIVIHAEANAILFAAKTGIQTEGATLYVTTSPCIECAKMILQAGIERLVYKDSYKCDSGIMLLKRYIEVEQYGLQTYVINQENG